MYRSSYILSSIALILVLSAIVLPQAQQKPPEEPPPVLSVPKDYRYNARGRRDPFVNPVPKPAAPRGGGPVAQAPQCPQGLKGVLVAQAAIAGVVTSREPSMNVVIIGAPGGKTYFARVGDALCDALVKTIKLDAVTFVVTSGPEGNPQTPAREIMRKVRPSPGEEK